jgi:3-hydroxyisobutyrate dehydrogenase
MDGKPRDMARITFLGTGLLGSGIVTGMRSRGDAVTVWNRTLEKARRLESIGANVAETPQDAVRGAQRVHLCVSDDDAVDALLERIRPALDPKTIVVDHSTVSPAGTSARYARAADYGYAFLHAPVFMSPQMAAEAKGIVLCSGPEALFEPVRPALEPMAEQLLYLGDDPHKAAAFKLFGNAMIVTLIAGLADIFTIAKAAGISANDAISLFAHFSPAGNLAYRGTKMAEGSFLPAMFELTMARKDLRLMLETAGHGKTPLVILPEIAKRMDELIGKGHGSEDLGVLAIDAIA